VAGAGLNLAATLAEADKNKDVWEATAIGERFAEDLSQDILSNPIGRKELSDRLGQWRRSVNDEISQQGFSALANDGIGRNLDRIGLQMESRLFPTALRKDQGDRINALEVVTSSQATILSNPDSTDVERQTAFQSITENYGAAVRDGSLTEAQATKAISRKIRESRDVLAKSLILTDPDTAVAILKDPSDVPFLDTPEAEEQRVILLASALRAQESIPGRQRRAVSAFDGMVSNVLAAVGSDDVFSILENADQLAGAIEGGDERASADAILGDLRKYAAALKGAEEGFADSDLEGYLEINSPQVGGRPNTETTIAQRIKKKLRREVTQRWSRRQQEAMARFNDLSGAVMNSASTPEQEANLIAHVGLMTRNGFFKTENAQAAAERIPDMVSSFRESGRLLSELTQGQMDAEINRFRNKAKGGSAKLANAMVERLKKAQADILNRRVSENVADSWPSGAGLADRVKFQVENGNNTPALIFKADQERIAARADKTTTVDGFLSNDPTRPGIMDEIRDEFGVHAPLAVSQLVKNRALPEVVRILDSLTPDGRLAAVEGFQVQRSGTAVEGRRAVGVEAVDINEAVGRQWADLKPSLQHLTIGSFTDVRKGLETVAMGFAARQGVTAFEAADLAFESFLSTYHVLGATGETLVPRRIAPKAEDADAAVLGVFAALEEAVERGEIEGELANVIRFNSNQLTARYDEGRDEFFVSFTGANFSEADLLIAPGQRFALTFEEATMIAKRRGVNEGFSARFRDFEKIAQ
jgi:hypothetical protein